LSVIRSIQSDSGIKGLFRGTLLTIGRDVPGSFMYFLTYVGLKRTMGDSVPCILFAGGMAGMINWAIAIPLDTIKSRMQSVPNSEALVSKVVSNLLKQEGYKGLFRGLRPTLLRAFPASAAFFFGVEGSNMIMNKYAT
jgi:solute carrier family 25 (mitochondrial carnitine/acylcarnitine transporter), member 20/29